MKRILILISSQVIGGHEFQALNLAQDLAKFVNVTVVVNTREQLDLFAQNLSNVILKEGQVFSKGILPVQLWKGLLGRRCRILTQGYDHVIVSAGTVEAGAAYCIALRGSAWSLYLPSLLDRKLLWGKLLGGLYNTALYALLRLPPRIITINRIQKSILRKITSAEVCTIKNRIRDAKALAEGEGRLLYIGRLDKQKRVDQLIRWLDCPNNPMNTFVVVGDGPERQRLVAMASQTVCLKVEFAGWLNSEQQDQFIRKDDVVLLNSMYEGEPMVLREAWLRGNRIAVRDIPGVKGVTLRSQRFDSKAALINLIRSESNPIESSRFQMDKQESSRARGLSCFWDAI